MFRIQYQRFHIEVFGAGLDCMFMIERSSDIHEK